MTIRRLIAPLAVAIFGLGGGAALAQGAFPAPLPGQGQAGTINDPAFPPVNGGSRAVNDPAFPPVNGSPATATMGAPSGGFPVNGAPPVAGGFSPAPSQAAAPPDDCMKGFLPLREEAERRGKLIKAASDRHAPPDEACKLIKNFGQAETKMISYVQGHATKCGIPAQVADQLKAGHKNTEALQTKVCAVAMQMQQRGPAGPTLSDVLGSAAAVPEATPTKRGGSTFDTLNGNVLAR